jgi:hypothetical protein
VGFRQAVDVGVELANGVLAIKGEKRAETEDKERLFSERYYGRFERRIPVDDIEADKVNASFKSGVLTVTLPKSAKAQEKVRPSAGVTPLPRRLRSGGDGAAGDKEHTSMLDGTGWYTCADPVRISR